MLSRVSRQSCLPALERFKFRYSTDVEEGCLDPVRCSPMDLLRVHGRSLRELSLAWSDRDEDNMFMAALGFRTGAPKRPPPLGPELSTLGLHQLTRLYLGSTSLIAGSLAPLESLRRLEHLTMQQCWLTHDPNSASMTPTSSPDAPPILPSLTYLEVVLRSADPSYSSGLGDLETLKELRLKYARESPGTLPPSFEFLQRLTVSPR